MQTRIYNLVSASIRNVFLFRNISTGRCLLQTHYDVLKLPRSCTPQEIRSSFIKLSKEYHPDMNTQDDNRHALFVRLNEAYTVLSRPESRKKYDLSLIPNRATSHFSTEPFGVHKVRPFKDPSFWENRVKSNIYSDRPYYGIKGVKKMSNAWIVIFCFIFTSIGVALQVLLIKFLSSHSRKVFREIGTRKGTHNRTNAIADQCGRGSKRNRRNAENENTVHGQSPHPRTLPSLNRQSFSFSRKNLDEQSQQNALTYAMVREKALREGDVDVFRRMELNADKFGNRQQVDAKKEN